MKKISGKSLISFGFAVLVFSGMVVFAANNDTLGRALNILRPEIKVQMSATVNREGKKLQADKVDTVNSGEIIDWNINSTNSGNASARNFKIVGQIPTGTTFVLGSARSEADALVTYSIDGGKSFSAQPMIDERQENGEVKKVAAPVSMFTQVRFEYNSELGADASSNASYRVRVK